MARWFVMDRRVASELKKNYFFYLLSPARDGYATVFTYWEALTDVRRAGIFSYDQSVASHVFLKGRRNNRNASF